jgi:selenocysteine lyase/cysteine desulfurase
MRFLAGLPEGVRLHGLPTMTGRVPTFCFDAAGLSPRETPEELAAPDIAVWWGNHTRSRRCGASGSTPSKARCSRASSTTARPTKSTGSSPL